MEVPSGDLDSVYDVVFDFLRSVAIVDFTLIATFKPSCVDANGGQEYKKIPSGLGAQGVSGFFAHGLTDCFHLHNRAKLPGVLVAI
jgi:hypothetical protein